MPEDESEENEEKLTLRKAERSGSSLSHWFWKVTRPMLDDFLASGLMGLDRKRRLPRPDVVGVAGYTWRAAEANVAHSDLGGVNK